MRLAMGIRFVAALAVIVGLSFAGVQQASADHFTATIHAMECYSGVGPDIFEECHTDVDVATSVVEIDGTSAILVIPEDVLALYLGAYIYCRDLVDDEVLFDGNYADTGGGAIIAVEDGDDIVCDIYLITPAPKDDGGYDGGGSTSGGGVTTVTTLPSTGSGSGSSSIAGPGSAPFMLLASLLALTSAVVIARLRRSAR